MSEKLIDKATMAAIAVIMTVALITYPAFGIQAPSEAWAGWGLAIGYFVARKVNGVAVTSTPGR